MTTAPSEGPSGLIVVDKPAGITSHTAVARARRTLGTRKVGHAGTLDPMATGVLVLGVGRGTRLLGHLSLTTKSYEATIRLGQATTTDDAEGEVTDAAGASASVVKATLPEALKRYRGDIDQVPSSVSAIKVGGQRAYALARRGEQVELAARRVTVTRLDAVAVRPADAAGLGVVDVDVVVDCSSGTYIRALARDLGADLGAGGHLTALRRTQVGPFGLDDVSDALLGLADVARLAFPTVSVDRAVALDAVHGRPLPLVLDAEPAAVLHGDVLLGLYRADGPVARPLAVLAGPADLR